MILDVFPSYKDKDMVDLLYRYERETCLSLNILVEKYLEEKIKKNGYLTVEIEEEHIEEDSEKESIKETIENDSEEVETSPETDNMKYITFHKGSLKWMVNKWTKGKKYTFGTYPDIEDAKIVRDFLVSKNWDVKYSTLTKKLKGQKYI